VTAPPSPPSDGSPDPALSPGDLLAERVVFVLVQPQHPGNVGAVARAMKNMGLRRLIVVNPPPSFDLERARWMAPGAADVLAEMRITATLDEALVGVHRAVATTARRRADAQAIHEPAGFARSVFETPDDIVTAVLFGREDDGLSRAETLRCESLVRIVTDHTASLNLAQAALLVGHHLFEAARTHGLNPDGRVLSGGHGPRSTRSLDRRDATRPADLRRVEPIVRDLTALLDRVGFQRSGDPERIGLTLRELLQRSRLTDRHVSALMGMIGRIDYALDHPHSDWRGTRRDHERKAEDPSDDGIA
jgi:TrmH family RNA methyltransferase